MEDAADGFNRDIVECKVYCLSSLYNLLFGFNRDIVECKVDDLCKNLDVAHTF